MASSFVQLFGYMVSLIGMILTIIICARPNWRVNDLDGEVIESIRRSSGLWSRCTYYNTGNWQCDQYDTFFLGLPAPLQVARACVCIALAFQGIASLAAFAGMECTNLIPSYETADPEGENAAVKRKIMLGVGGCVVFAGVSLCVGVSYYAATVLQEYNGTNMMRMSSMSGGMRGSNTQLQVGERYIYGYCTYLGWMAMIVNWIGGGIIICASCQSSSIGDGSMYGTQRGLISPNYAQPNQFNGGQRKTNYDSNEYL